MQEVFSLAQLEDMCMGAVPLFVRYSKGPVDDARGGSVDTESGCVLPGLSVNPLSPEPWWTRPVQDWLARQLCQYKHLRDKNERRRAWVVTGQVVGRGPDCEPLLVDCEFVAIVSPAALAEAESRYASSFDAGQGPEDPPR